MEEHGRQLVEDTSGCHIPRHSTTRWDPGPQQFRRVVELGGEEGVKTVYVWYRDRDGNVSRSALDSVVLDRHGGVPLWYWRVRGCAQIR